MTMSKMLKSNVKELYQYFHHRTENKTPPNYCKILLIETSPVRNVTKFYKKKPPYTPFFGKNLIDFADCCSVSCHLISTYLEFE